MPLIEWDEERYGVDIDAIDRLHKKLIELLNELNETLVGTESDLLPEEAVSEVREHTALLFAEEERLMKEIGYPRYETHIQDHADFSNTLQQMAEELSEGHFLLRTKLMQGLKTWLEKHITEADQDYSNFFYQDDNILLQRHPSN
jgi:hemerythrin-like metal-binding protein